MGNEAESAQLVSSLVAAGVGIGEWRLDRAGLEELFLQLTEDSERPNGSGNGSGPAPAEPTEENAAAGQPVEPAVDEGEEL